jgi:hypothetical protein
MSIDMEAVAADTTVPSKKDNKKRLQRPTKPDIDEFKAKTSVLQETSK